MTRSKTMQLAFGLALSLGACGAPAHAAPISFAPQGDGTTAYTTTGLGFGPGNALAVGALPNGAPITVGQTFTLLFQTHLTSLAGVNAVAGLNTSFQVTEVATLTETVTSVTNAGGVSTATFALTPSAANRVNIYENNAVVFNDAAGTGFAVGTVIASLTPTSFTASQFTSTAATATFNQTGAGNNSGSGNAVVGSGSTGVNSAVTSSNASFFRTQPLTTSLLNSNLSTVFDSISPSLQFTNISTSAIVTPNIGSVNGQSGPDIQFQVSGFTQSFNTAVPEPASVAMTVLGLVGAGFGSVVARRRARAAV